jgi:hypothetical protein
MSCSDRPKTLSMLKNNYYLKLKNSYLVFCSQKFSLILSQFVIKRMFKISKSLISNKSIIGLKKFFLQLKNIKKSFN